MSQLFTPTTAYRPDTRKHELDWLRVLAFGLLIMYHLGMAYVEDWGWHVKSHYQSEFLQNLMLWSNQWRMSLLFLISGAALSFSIQHGDSLRFPLRLTRRMMPPLLFGMLVIVAPQVYVELKTKGHIAELNYLHFWLHYAGSAIGLGHELPEAYIRGPVTNLTWNHLWYLPYLLCYAWVIWVIHVLLSRLTKKPPTRASLPPAAVRPNLIHLALIPTGLLTLPIVGLYLIDIYLWKPFPTTFDLANDWYNHARYFFVFCIGFFCVQQARVWSAFAQLRRFTLGLALLSYCGIVFFYHGGHLFSDATQLERSLDQTFRSFIWAANRWFWIMAIVGYAQRYLARPHPLVQTANAGVFCFYILHQSLIVLLVYWLSPYFISPWLEPILVSVGTLLGCVSGYWLVQKTGVLKGWVGVSSSLPRKNSAMSGVEAKPRTLHSGTR